MRNVKTNHETVVEIAGKRFDFSKYNGTFDRSNMAKRRCARCGAELSDPASWVRGMGPLCYGKSTGLYAKTIPANYAMVVADSHSLAVTNMPGVLQEPWLALKEVIAQNLTRIGDQDATDCRGFDVRGIVRVIDWMLSFDIPAFEKRQLIAIVKNLGYISLASVLAGEASTGKSSLTFENGRIILKGSSNKNGYYAMRKIKGIRYPQYRGSEEPYSAPVEQFEEFLMNVYTYWPCFDDDIEGIRRQVTAFLEEKKLVLQAAAPTVEVEIEQEEPAGDIAYITKDANQKWFELSFEWIKEKTPVLVNLLKVGISYKNRTYMPDRKVWGFRVDDLEQVKKIITQANYVPFEKNGTVSLNVPTYRR